MFNFVDPILSPKVVCNSPSMDNHEVDNLISDNSTIKLRGFMVYPAIKPPVEIEFDFICPVNMHYISLNTTVGSQKCNGIEIWAKNKDIGYTSVGRAIFDSPGIIFRNNKMYSKKNLPEKLNRNFEIRGFKSETFKLFLNASSIKIVIFRTDKSVPCLGSVEVWGTPSKSCSQVTVETITRLAMKSEMKASESTHNIAVNEVAEFIIPNDFKDDLTCEIMVLPMTLPSGKSIDQSTLEKHIQSEKSFGRKPGDPFTGIKFTNEIKPILNVALKSRIDMFILRNSHRPEFSNLRRTLGGCKSDLVVKRKRDSPENTISDDPLEASMSRAKRDSSFVSFTSDVDSKIVCFKCKIELNCLYRIPCDHFYCRKCLLHIRDISRCEICNKSFTTNEITKVNL